MASNEWLVRKLLEQDKKIEALSRGGTGVGHSSIAPGENLTVISDNGEVVLGAGGVEHVDGPTPATPSAPTLKLGFGTIETTWDGTFAEGEDEDGVPLTAPVDFDVVEVHCSTDPEEEEWGDDTRRGQIKTREGGTITVGGFDVDDEVFVCLIALAKTGKRSAPSATASLVIEGLDFSALFNELDAANATIKNAGEILVTEQGTLDEKLSEVDGTLNDLGQDLAAVEDAQAQLNTDLTDVMTSVDGKNTITWNPSAPSAVSNPGKAVGDLWYRASGNSIIGFWKWDGTDWVTQLLDKTTIPLIDIGAGTFGTMKGSRLEAGSVTADRLVVGVSQNLVVDPKFKNVTINEARTTKGSLNTWDVVQSGTETWYRNKPGVPLNSRFFYLTTDGVSNNPETRMAVENTTKWSMSIDVMVEAGSSVRISRMQASLVAYKADGSAQFLAQNFTRPDGSLPVEIGEGWVTLRASYDWSGVAGVVSVAPRIYVTTGGTDGTYYFRNPNISEMVGTTLIEDGGITTPKLAADVLEVKNLKATSGQLNEAVINKLFADVVVAKTSVSEAFIGENAILTGAVTASKITASEELWAKIGRFVKIRAEQLEADAIDGMVITGATIRSAATGARVQLSASGIESYNDANDRTFYAEASSGNVYMVGSFYSNKEGEPRVAIKNSDWASIGVPDENGNLHYTNGAGIRIGSNATSGFSIYHGAWQDVGDPPGYIRGQTAAIEGPLARTDLSLTDSGNVELESRNSSGVTVGRLGIRGNGSVYGTSYSNGARVLALSLGAGHANLSSFSSSGDVWGSVGANNSGSGYIQSTNGSGFIRATVQTNTDGKIELTGTGDLYMSNARWQLANLNTTTGSANMRFSGSASSSGFIGLLSSSRRFKVAEEPLSETVPEFVDRLMSVEAKTWFDKNSAERLAASLEPDFDGADDLEDVERLRRIPGVVAEDLHDAGLGVLVEYDDNGDPSGVMYDRLGVALFPVVKELRDRITELERHTNG